MFVVLFHSYEVCVLLVALVRFASDCDWRLFNLLLHKYAEHSTEYNTQYTIHLSTQKKHKTNLAHICQIYAIKKAYSS